MSDADGEAPHPTHTAPTRPQLAMMPDKGRAAGGAELRVADVAAAGVAEPLKSLFATYNTAASSGAPEHACRVAFQDAFQDPSSPASAHMDDMVWLVTTSQGEPVSLVRKPQLTEKLRACSSLAQSVLWQETLALNIVTQWHFTLTVAVVKIINVGDSRQMLAVRRSVKRVYGTPTKAMFQSKEGRADDSIDYPNIYFNVDDFEETFGDIQLSDGYGFAVLLTVGDSVDSNAAIFRGVLTYQVLMQRVAAKYKATKKAPTQENREFIPLLGPRKEGKAEVAVCISDAELIASRNSSVAFAASASNFASSTTDSPQGSFSTRNPSRASNGSTSGSPPKDSAASEGFFSRSKTTILERVSTAFGSQKVPACEVFGDEALQCCLTFVSVNVRHVLMVMASREGVRRQWLRVAVDRRELDELLEQQRALEEAALAQRQQSDPRAETSATSSARMSPTSTASPELSRASSLLHDDAKHESRGQPGDASRPAHPNSKDRSPSRKRLGVFDAIRKKLGGSNTATASSNLRT